MWLNFVRDDTFYGKHSPRPERTLADIFQPGAQNCHQLLLLLKAIKKGVLQEHASQKRGGKLFGFKSMWVFCTKEQNDPKVNGCCTFSCPGSREQCHNRSVGCCPTLLSHLLLKKTGLFVLRHNHSDTCHTCHLGSN